MGVKGLVASVAGIFATRSGQAYVDDVVVWAEGLNGAPLLDDVALLLLSYSPGTR